MTKQERRVRAAGSRIMRAMGKELTEPETAAPASTLVDELLAICIFGEDCTCPQRRAADRIEELESRLIVEGQAALDFEGNANMMRRDRDRLREALGTISRNHTEPISRLIAERALAGEEEGNDAQDNA